MGVRGPAAVAVMRGGWQRRVILGLAIGISACGGSTAVGDDAAVGCVDHATAPTAEDVVCGEPGTHLALPYDAAQLDGCTYVRGGVHLPDASDVEALAPLAAVRRIDGRFTIFRNHVLSDLRGLEGLESIGGELSIRIDDSGGAFTSVEGLSGVCEIGALEIDLVGGLQSLAGLSALQRIGGDVSITNNPALPSSEVATLLGRVVVEGEVVVDANGP